MEPHHVADRDIGEIRPIRGETTGLRTRRSGGSGAATEDVGSHDVVTRRIEDLALTEQAFPPVIGIGGARLRFETLGVWAALLGVLVLLGLLLRRTRTGLAFRAITANRESARLVGIDVGRTLMFGWAVAGGLGALAATLVADAVLLEPNMMLRLMIFSFAAATIGGLDSPKGAIVGAIIVGMTQTLIPGYTFVPSELSLLPPLVAMFLILMFKPTGLFGERQVERV